MVETGRQGAETCVRRVGQKRLLFSMVRAWRSQGVGELAVHTQISNWERYLLARRFDRAPRARVARHPPPRLQALRTSFAAVRAGTSLCSAPKVRRQDPAGESYPPRRSPGGVGAAAATAGEHGRLPPAPRRCKKRHERWFSKATRHRRQPLWADAADVHLPRGGPLGGSM